LLQPRLPAVINAIGLNTLQQFVIHSRDHGRKTLQNCQRDSILSAMRITGSRMAQECVTASMKVVVSGGEAVVMNHSFIRLPKITSRSYLAVAFRRPRPLLLLSRISIVLVRFTCSFFILFFIQFILLFIT
jgi:hypothetical protein